jgi:hypothetical protein
MATMTVVTNMLLFLAAALLFAIAAIVAHGTKFVLSADVWAYAGLAVFAPTHLV